MLRLLVQQSDCLTTHLTPPPSVSSRAHSPVTSPPSTKLHTRCPPPRRPTAPVKLWPIPLTSRIAHVNFMFPLSQNRRHCHLCSELPPPLTRCSAEVPPTPSTWVRLPRPHGAHVCPRHLLPRLVCVTALARISVRHSSLSACYRATSRHGTTSKRIHVVPLVRSRRCHNLPGRCSSSSPRPELLHYAPLPPCALSLSHARS